MLKNFLAMIGATVDWFPDRTDRKSATRNTLLPAVIVIDFKGIYIHQNLQTNVLRISQMQKCNIIS